LIEKNDIIYKIEGIKKQMHDLFIIP